MLSLLLGLVSVGLMAQEADTLEASAVYSVKYLPVVRPAEEVRLQEEAAVPSRVSDVVRRFTGVQVKDYGGVGGLKTVNVRSLGSEHTGIFLDGIRIDNAQNMQVDLGRFSTDGIGKVTLYNGQKTRRLQTASEYASGAAIHLESAVPDLPDGFGGRLRMRGGSFGTINPSLRWNQRIGPVILSASAEFLMSSGRYKYRYFDTTLVRENGYIKSLRVEAQAFGKVKGGDWRLRLYGYGSERGFPGPVIRRALGFPLSAERQADQDIFVQGGWNQEWHPRFATALKFKYANNYTHYNTHAEKNPMAMPYDLHYRQQSGYVSLASSYIPADAWSVDLSVDVRHNSLDSDVGNFVTPRRTSVAGALAARFAREKFRAAAHLVYAGAWDRFKTPEAGGWSRQNAYRDAWMPSLTLFYRPLEWLEADAFFKRTCRLPSFNDLYYTLIGNSHLKPESALQCGIDLRASRKAWEVRVSPYYNRVNNKIVAIPTASQFRWTMLNIGIADIVGVDVKAEGRLTAGGVLLVGTGRYTYQLALDHSDKESLIYGNQIPYIPRHSGSLALDVSWKGLSFSWTSTFTGERWSRTANTPDYRIAPWTVSDASLQWKPCLKAFRNRQSVLELSLGVVVGNVFNQQYQIVQGYPMPGTNAMASLEFAW